MRKLCISLALALCAIAGDKPARPSRAEMEEFLLTATIVSHRYIGYGVTDSQRALLRNGAMEHEAHIQTIDEAKNTFNGGRTTEINFKDRCSYNVAAYRLDKILDLNMVPVSVERHAFGKTAAVTWWVDDKLMDETDRFKHKLRAPDQDFWNQQMWAVRVFDQLIFNTDRNLGNLVIDKSWRIWMIDHTRAFRINNRLENPKQLGKCDRRLLAAMRKLNQSTLDQELIPYLSKSEIRALLRRRDRIVQFFDELTAAQGESVVLYDLPPRG